MEVLFRRNTIFELGATVRTVKKTNLNFVLSYLLNSELGECTYAMANDEGGRRRTQYIYIYT